MAKVDYLDPSLQNVEASQIFCIHSYKLVPVILANRPNENFIVQVGVKVKVEQVYSRYSIVPCIYILVHTITILYYSMVCICTINSIYRYL